MGWDAPSHLPRGVQLEGPSAAAGMKQQGTILRENDWLTLENSRASILCTAGLGMHCGVGFFFFYYAMENVFLSKPNGSSATLKY